MAVKEQTSSFEPKPFGRYVLVDKLAVGGMAEIYKAKTYGVDGFEKILAVKRILPHCAADKEFINMLVDEAKLTVLLSHANIVQVFDLGKVGDDYFISMEFINGTNLREMVGRAKEKSDKLPEEIAVYIMSEMCKGLDYAHRKTDSQGNPLNIVHRDISPQNILISFEGEVKIVDFGIAKAAMNVSHTMAGILKGKIAYMSPEQALGKPIDHRTDIFSAGVVLYEMLSGDKLFSGETQFEVLNQIRTTRINTMMLPDHIPGPLKAILAKALAYNTKDRYQSAGDFQLDLTKFLYSSYIDFSPRHLASLVCKYFENEMRRKEPSGDIDEKTRSVLVRQAGMENIVVHGAPKAAEAAPSIQTATTGLVGAATAKKGARKALVWTGAVVSALLVGYLAYNFALKDLLRPKPEPTPTTDASKPPTPPDEGPAIGDEFGSILVESDPAGAKILLNGSDTGLVSPATLPKLALGEEYQVALVKENYRDLSKTIPITTAEPATLKETLQPLSKGILEIESNPPGARIALNGQEMGQVTPGKIENLEIKKNYSVKLSLPNYYEWTGTADLKDFQPFKLQAALTPVPAQLVQPTAPVQPTQPIATPQPTVPTPPTQPPAPTYGKVRIDSSPSGARVLLNGRSTGRSTPTTLENLEDGKRVTLALLKDGYKDWSRTVTVEGNRTSNLSASLREIEPEPAPPPLKPPVEAPDYKPPPTPPVEASIPKRTVEPEPTIPSGGKPGSLSIDSDPSGAEVYVNAEYKGTTPVKVSNVAAGNVKVTVSKDGFMRRSVSLRLNPGENKSLGSIRLGSQFGEISIRSTPPRATVVFDGETIGARTPVTIRRVPRDRSHSIRIQLDGYRDWASSVDLSDQENKKYDVLLEKQ